MHTFIFHYLINLFFYFLAWPQTDVKKKKKIVEEQKQETLFSRLSRFVESETGRELTTQLLSGLGGWSVMMSTLVFVIKKINQLLALVARGQHQLEQQLAYGSQHALDVAEADDEALRQRIELVQMKWRYFSIGFRSHGQRLIHQNVNGDHDLEAHQHWLEQDQQLLEEYRAGFQDIIAQHEDGAQGDDKDDGAQDIRQHPGGCGHGRDDHLMNPYTQATAQRELKPGKKITFFFHKNDHNSS